MKVFALVLLFTSMLLVGALEDEDLKRCEKCFDQEKALVCSNLGTMFNMCLLECMNAKEMHPQECKFQDLMDSKRIEK